MCFCIYFSFNYADCNLWLDSIWSVWGEIHCILQHDTSEQCVLSFPLTLLTKFPAILTWIWIFLYFSGDLEAIADRRVQYDPSQSHNNEHCLTAMHLILKNVPDRLSIILTLPWGLVLSLQSTSNIIMYKQYCRLTFPWRVGIFLALRLTLNLSLKLGAL